MSSQRHQSTWMLVAILQSVFWLFGIPILCRKYVWDNVFGALIASSPNHGMEIAETVFVMSVPILFFTSYTLVMIPIYAGQYPFFEQYRIQQQHQHWPWFDPRPQVREEFWKLSIRSLKLAAFNMFLLIPFLTIIKIYAIKYVFKMNDAFLFSTDNEHWPSTSKNIRDVVLLAVIHDFGFYATHKLTHIHPFLYKYHKIHHEYKINTTLAAQHNHPIDYLISVGGPAILSLALVSGAHSITQFQWLLWSMYANLDDHVGYAFPWSPVRWFPFSAGTKICLLQCFPKR